MLRIASRLGGLATVTAISSMSSGISSSESMQPSFGATVNLKKTLRPRDNNAEYHIAMDLDKILLIAGSAHPKLASDVSGLIDVPLANVAINRFADGEVSVQINDSVRGKNVFIIQTCAAPVNDNVMELLLTISCARRSGASSINAVIPYFGYKHHRRGSPISTKHGSRFLASGAMDFAKMLTEMGVDRVIAVDLQRPGQGSEACFFDNTVPLESIGTTSLQMNYLIEHIEFKNPIVIVAPNAECAKKARQCQTMLQKALEVDVKMSTFFQFDTSSGPTDPEKLQLLETSIKFNGADVIIVDDMIDSAGTIHSLSERLQGYGAAKIYACASHGVFTEDAMATIEASPIDKVFVTDSLPLSPNRSDKIVQIPIAALIARVVLAEHFRSTSEAVAESFEEDFSGDS
jgi:ribose-phosphate pyrophosphokinase